MLPGIQMNATQDDEQRCPPSTPHSEETTGCVQAEASSAPLQHRTVQELFIQFNFTQLTTEVDAHQRGLRSGFPPVFTCTSPLVQGQGKG